MTKRTPKQTETTRPEWKGFLELRLTDQQLADADLWKLTANAAMESVSSLLLEGYKLNLSYSTKIDMATAMLTGGVDMKEVAGWALSAQGENGADALKLLLFKHYEILKRDWTPLIAAPSRVRRG